MIGRLLDWLANLARIRPIRFDEVDAAIHRHPAGKGRGR